MRILIFASLLGSFAVTALFSGCTTSVNTVENANKEGRRNMVADERVVTDSSLEHKVSIVGVNTSMTPGGLLKVQVELQNNTHSFQRYLYQFEWFDANGMQLNNVLSATIPDQIEGAENKFIYCVAPSPNCRDFRVKFIKGN